MGAFFFFHFVLYSFNHISIDSKYFYTLGYNLVLLYFVAQIVLTLAIENLFLGSCVPSRCCIFCLCVFWRFLTFWHFKILPPLFQNQLSLQGVLITFIQEQCQKPVFGYFICSLFLGGVVAFIQLSQLTEQENVCMLICVCTCLYKYFYKISIAHLTCLSAFFFFLYSLFYLVYLNFLTPFLLKYHLFFRI